MPTVLNFIKALAILLKEAVNGCPIKPTIVDT